MHKQSEKFVLNSMETIGVIVSLHILMFASGTP